MSDVAIATSTLNWTHLYLYPIGTTILCWGLLTSGMLWLNRRDAWFRQLILISMGVVLFIAHQQIWLVRDDVSTSGIYRAFIASMLIWAWHELAFYSGVLTGPWRKDCPPTARGWQRLQYALATHWYHIVAVGIDMVLLWNIHSDSLNQTGLYTFGLLWVLQLSAKLNVLLGVRNFQSTLLPHHLRYLASFWNQRPHNLFLLPSILAASLLAAILWQQATITFPNSLAISLSFLASVATLGALEHCLLVFPVRLSHNFVN